MKFDGGKLKTLREARRLDQTSLAEKARKLGSGLTQASVSRYEHGMEPNGRNALALASALGVDVRELYSDESGKSDDDEEDSLPSLDAALRGYVMRLIAEQVKA